MYSTKRTQKKETEKPKASSDLFFDLAIDENNHGRNHGRFVNSKDFRSYMRKYESENWTNELDKDWQCIASDYSVQYKRMHKRYHPLHSNNLSIDLHSLTTVDDCKVADITRCSYAMQEGQCIRVSVHATLVFKQ